MERFSNGRCQEVDLEMLKKPMEFPPLPRPENKVLRDLDSSTFLDLESGVRPGQYPSLDPDILDLKSGKKHQWTDYQWKGFEDLFNQKYGGTKLMVKIFWKTLVRPQISISKNFKGALKGGTSGPPKEEKGAGSECQDAERERSRSGTSQDLDGGVESSSSESQGQGPDRGEGSASVENQGGDGNSEGNGSGDGEDEYQGGVDVENGGQENNQEEIDSPRNETNMAIIGTTTIAAVDFHYNGFISTTILGLLTAINVFGFLCCMTSTLHRHRNPRAARKFGTIGAAAGSFGFLLLVSVPFSSYYPWVIFILGSIALLVIFVLAFK